MSTGFITQILKAARASTGPCLHVLLCPESFPVCHLRASLTLLLSPGDAKISGKRGLALPLSHCVIWDTVNLSKLRQGLIIAKMPVPKYPDVLLKMAALVDVLPCLETAKALYKH